MASPYRFETTSGVTYSVIGACGPDGRCLTCGTQGDTAGCQSCRSTAIPATTTIDTTTVSPYGVSSVISCGHGRTNGSYCTHCLGL